MGTQILRSLAALAILAVATTAYADHPRKYEVTITNITRGQTFTPQLLVTHKSIVKLFELGQPASLGLEILAEDGMTGPLSETLAALGNAVDAIQTVPGLLEPGHSVTTTIEADRHHRFLSMAAMLIPTNDTFVALNRIRLPRYGAITRTARAYDAGTERNDQNCLNIPGPRCGGAGHSPGPNEGDETYVYVSNGFHTLPPVADGEVLGPLVYDWRNPVAQIVVRRVY